MRIKSLITEIVDLQYNLNSVQGEDQYVGLCALRKLLELAFI